MNTSIDAWRREALVLAEGLLDALDNASPTSEASIYLHLTPDDFPEGKARERFSRRRYHWQAVRVTTQAADSLGRPSAKPDQAPYPLVERLVRLQGAIRLAEATEKALAAIGGDLSLYDHCIQELSDEVATRLRRLGLLRIDPEVWEDGRARIIQSLGRLEERMRTEGTDHDSTLGWAGLDELDQATGPLQPGCLYLLGATPGEGKTAFLAMLARSYATKEKRCGLLALRDTTESLTLRMLCGQGGVAPEMLTARSWNLGTHLSFSDGMVELAACFPAAAQCRNSPRGALYELARSFISAKHLEVLLVDDLGFALQGREFSAGHSELFRSITKLRELAQRMWIPVVATVGLDVADTSAGTAPKATDVVRYAGMDFFAVLTASRNPDGDVVHQLEVVRNSFGPPVTLALVYQRRHQRFFPLSTELADQ